MDTCKRVRTHYGDPHSTEKNRPRTLPVTTGTPLGRREYSVRYRSLLVLYDLTPKCDRENVKGFLLLLFFLLLLLLPISPRMFRESTYRPKSRPVNTKVLGPVRFPYTLHVETPVSNLSPFYLFTRPPDS